MNIRNLRFSFFFTVVLILLACKEDNSATPVIQTPIPEGKFRNPVLTASPDPWVFQKDDWYYYTYTTGNSIRISRSEIMSDLSQAQVKTIWTAPASGMNSRNIWAPEMHFINGKWYFYYAADDGNNSNHRMWVLENSSADPFQGTWVDKGKLALPEDKWAIDGNIFEHDDQLYFAWSGWEGTTDVRQDIYITTMSDPLTPGDERIMLTKPEYTWETRGAPPGVNEGPQYLRKDDKVFITYSASGCWTDDYALGLLTASATSDLMNPSSWVKSSEPVFAKNPDGQVFGPGHNAFFKSPDGTEDWMIYHANAASGLGCGNQRSFRIQKINWDSNGNPVFGSAQSLNTILERPSGEK